MCPNCLTSIAMALGGAGSAVLLAAAGLRFRPSEQPSVAEGSSGGML
jgi:hypothetical protein